MTFTANKLPMALAIFCSGRICERQSCPIFAEQNGVLNCHIFVRDNPDKAAEIMGLEVVEVEDKDKPRLTEQELAICKAVGAKWVSFDDTNEDVVDIWTIKPETRMFDGKRHYYEQSTEHIACVNSYLFPSLKPGDCINVEEILKEVEP